VVFKKNFKKLGTLGTNAYAMYKENEIEVTGFLFHSFLKTK